MEKIEEYRLIHDKVIEYKNGVKGAADELINFFEVPLNKYVKLFSKGIVDLEYSPTCSVVRSFSKRLGMGVISKNYKHKKSDQIKLLECATAMQKAFELYSTDEIYSTIVIAFLTLADRYSDTKPSFHTYFSRAFYYEVIRETSSMINDSLMLSSYLEDMNIDVVDDETSKEFILMDQYLDVICNINNSKHIAFKSEIKGHDRVLEDEYLDINWINGITSSECFKNLTIFERRLIVEHFINKRTDNSVAKEFGLCRATINRKRLKSFNKILM